VNDPGPVFTALADPTRRAVLRAVAGRGTATATELTGEIDVTRQAVAKHLRILEEAGLVAPERSGREQRYRVTPAPFTDALAWMAEVGAAWDERLDRLAARVARR
jgi:DNA-binding transcriptional ArsR family regulator